MIIKKEFHFTSAFDGLEIAGIACIPETECKGVVQFVHGMAEHKERYLPFMDYLAKEGYACYLHDHRGHGESVKQIDDLGYFYGENASSLIEDIHQLTCSIKKEYPTLPFILFGHSMGSLLVRAYCKKYDGDIDALIVCGSPSKNTAAGFGKLLVTYLEKLKGERYRSEGIQRLAFGTYHKKFNELHSKNVWLCSDMGVVQEYDEDPLCGFTFTLNGFKNLFSLLQIVYRPSGWKLHNSALPILFIAGELDPCIGNTTKFKEAVLFMKKVGYQDVEAKLFPGMRHEILNEKKKENVYSFVKEWIQKLEIHKNT